VTQAIFGLVGVVVGAVISGGVAFFMERRRDRQKARASARLLEEELEPFVGALYQLRASLLKENEAAFQVFIGQWNSFTLDLWTSRREALATTLAIEEWYSVMYAYVALGKLKRELGGLDFGTAQADEDLRGTVQSAESAVISAVETLGQLGGRGTPDSRLAGLLRGSRW
jgi:hypothetical protein